MARVRDLEWPSRIEESVWEEISQGVPAKDEPFIRKYEMGREALIAQEKKQRSGEYSSKHPRENLTNLLDHSFRQALSPLAREACEINDLSGRKNSRVYLRRRPEQAFIPG
jgi:adenosine deaminase CECR1